MTDLLEHYDAERADFERVLEGVRKIQAAPLDQLRSEDWLAEVIRDVGLVPIPESAITYQGEEDYLNASQQGLIQLPREFAAWLALLGKEKPASYLEIGCFNGATATIAGAVLRRWVPNARIVTCDVFPAFIFQAEARALVPLEYAVSRTSYDFVGQTFEAVFIDGDHSFEWAWADYQNVGRSARICALHDVRNAPYRDLPHGGVCAVWDLIRRQEPEAEFSEYFAHPTREIMGIGVRLRSR